MSDCVLVRLGLILVVVIPLVGVLGCRPDEPGGKPAGDSVEVAQRALFVNGDFESDSIGVVPTGWTTSTNLNYGITDTRPSPQTLASLNLMAGGYAATKVVGGSTETVADPDLGATASFRYPKYGARAALVNYASTTQKGSTRNVNTLTQTMTTTNADVDSSDNKVHVRFAVAPVLQSGGHPYVEQPYYYVALENLTRSTILYSDFNASAQEGVPWKTVGTIYYTDWQLVDIAPGNAALAVGDQVRLTVIAAGCSQSGHFGRAYVDGIGATIPGLFTWATGPAAANAGADITYTVNYRNGGTGQANGTTLSVVLPTNTTFKSVSLPSACTTPTVGNAGTVACSLGALAPGASGSFTLTVTIGSGVTAGTTITNGNYYIEATGVTALLGPKVLTSVTSGVTYADVSVTKTDGVAAVGWGQAVSYDVVVSNAGPGAATSVTVADTIPAQLTSATWTCTGAGGGTCTASGTGSLNTTASLPVGGSVTYKIAATVVAGTGSGSVANTATATVGGGASDPDTTNNTAVDTDSIGTLRTLSLTKVNANGGSVISVPASISCGTSCSSASGAFVEGTTVVLTASPVSGATFSGWSGACTGTSPSCSVTITADTSVTATFTPPPTVNIVTGNNQGAALGAPFGTSLTVQVLSSGGTPMVGETVVFTPPASGASATLSSTSVVTDSSGKGTVTATANGTAGAYSITAGLQGTPITTSFSVWNYGAAASIAVVSGSGQSASAGQAFTAPLVVVVRDAASQPVVGASVTFTPPVSGAGATIATSPATTNSSGQASVTATANATAGSYNVTASTAGVATSASFALTNSAGAPAQIVVSGGGTQSATVGTAFASPLLVTVKDMSGTAVPGATVTFSAPVTGARATLSATTGTTNASGQVSVSATAGTVAGSYAVSATVTGVATAATFALTNTPGVPAAIVATSGGGQTAIAGNAFAAPLIATVTDGYGNVVAGATVTFSAPGSGASATLGTSSATTDASGRASTAVTANGTAGSYAVTASVTGVAMTASFSLTNQAALAINPGTASVPPKGSVMFTASGGSGTGYTFAITMNRSGGTIDATTGAYRAGTTPNVTDVVTLHDSASGTATAIVTVGSGVSLTPATSTVAPKAIVSFTATGGSGSGYTFVVTTNTSGATVDATGKYKAGAAGNVTDIVTATDSLGNVGTAIVNVGPALALVGSNTSSPPRGSLTFSTTGGSGTGVTYALATNASGATIDTMTGAYTAGATPSVDDVVTATDSLGNIASASIQVGPGISVTPGAPAVAPLGRITFVASGGSGTGFQFTLTTNASAGTINATSGAYTAGATGNAVDVLTVVDSLGNSATVSISVGDGLSINPPTPTVAPGETKTFTAQGGSGTGYQFSLTTNTSHGQINATTGVYVAGSTGNATDVVTVTDSLGNQGTATVHVGPGLTVSPATAVVPPLATVTFAVSGGSGTGYQFTLATNGSGGFIGATNGIYKAGPIGSVTDQIRVTDSLGNVAMATVTVTARLLADPAVYTLPPRATQTLTVGGGAGGNAFSLVVNGSGGTVDPTTGAYQAGPNGDTSDIVLVKDVNGGVTSIAITVTAGVSINPSNVAVAPRETLQLSVEGGSGTGYSFELTMNASGGAVDDTTGVYVAGDGSDVTDVVVVTDSLGNFATAEITVGNGLVIKPSKTVIPPRGQIEFVASGGSGSGYRFSLEGTSGGTIDPDTGLYTAGPQGNTTDEVVVTDSLGNSATASVTVGDPLTITPPLAALPPLGALQFTTRGGSGAGLHFTLSVNASGGEIDPDLGSYVAGASPNVTDEVTVTDDLGNTAVAQVEVGSGLVISPPSAAVPPRGMVAFTASGGGGGYTFVLRQNGSGATIVSTSGAYVAGSRSGTTDIVEVMDGLGNVSSAVVSVGAALTLSPGNPHADPNGALTFVATGGSGTGYRFSLSMNGSGGTIDPSTGVYTAGDTNDSVDTVTVTDSLGNKASVNIAVGGGLAINPPTTTLAPRGQATFVAVGGSGSGYVFSLSSDASGASIDPISGAYVAGVKGGVTDNVMVTDSSGRTAVATVQVGPALTITPADSSVAPGSKVRFLVAGGAGFGDVFAVATNASGATIDGETGNYRAGTTGSVTDQVTVTDGLGNQAAAMVRVQAALTATPETALVPPQGSLQIVVSGGAAPYAFTLSQKMSGGTVASTNGFYRAGKVADTTDVVTVTDANRVTRQVTITVGPGITIAPGAPAVSSSGTVKLTATGGSGTGYAWKILDNRSRGNIDAGGTFTAGDVDVDVTDIVQVRDDLGNVAQVPVRVTATKAITVGGGSGCECAIGPETGRKGISVSVVALVFLAAWAARRRRRIER